MTTFKQRMTDNPNEGAAFALRIGLGLVFVIGGANKLGKLMNPATHDGLVASYTATSGYINSFFMEYLFSGRFGDWLTAPVFLTSLSAFELITGLFLIAGLAVRPLSLFYAFLLWTFVLALPVVTVPGVVVDVKTFHSPAILVMIRDIGLSGMMLVLFNLGVGAYALDNRFGLVSAERPVPGWDHLGLLLRLCVGFIFLVGGLFAGMDHIPTFAANPWILLIIGVALISGHGVKLAGYAAAAVLVWYMATKLSLDKSLIGNLNGIKRELAILAAALVLGWRDGGAAYKAAAFIGQTKRVLGAVLQKSG